MNPLNNNKKPKKSPLNSSARRTRNRRNPTFGKTISDEQSNKVSYGGRSKSRLLKRREKSGRLSKYDEKILEESSKIILKSLAEQKDSIDYPEPDKFSNPPIKVNPPKEVPDQTKRPNPIIVEKKDKEEKTKQDFH